jgi:hypothetical protein
MSTTSPPIAPPKVGGRPLLWLGLLAAIVGIPIYAGQMIAGKLTTPWYVPALASLGTALILLSLLRRLTVWRILALLFAGLITAGSGYFLFSMARLPDYTGPMAQGQEMPAFTTARADGTPFTQNDLKGDKDTVLVFFRGHW